MKKNNKEGINDYIKGFSDCMEMLTPILSISFSKMGKGEIPMSDS